MAEETQNDLKTNEATKQSFRKQVWETLEKNKLVLFPRPVYGRIPNFQGSKQAATKLSELEEFKSAKSVEVNPDKPLEHTRVIVLENNKKLYVPLPRLKDGLLKKLPAATEVSSPIKDIVSMWGIEHTGHPVDINDNIYIDMIVVGSVVVSKEGYRIGKGRGYADLEYAILTEMKAVDENTIIVTTVHDLQVYDTLPKELFEKYDIPVDYIVTPTRIIKVEKPLLKPSGIFWNLLSQRRVDAMPVLQKLKEKHTSEGRDTTLKEVDSDIDSNIKRPHRFKRFHKRRPRSASKTSEGDVNGDHPKLGRKKHKHSKRTRSNNINNSNGESTENTEESTPTKNNNQNRKPYRRSHFDYSFMVSNIEKSVRIRDLKSALNDHGIKPNDITWRGYRGFCYLHYAKPTAKKNNVDSHQPFGVDNVIEILQNLKINSAQNSNLNVKVMEPITRIETTDITSV